MARIRTIKPQFFLNEQLAELPAMVRLLFIGLWTQADREGRLVDRPKRLKAEIFPYDNFDMEKGLNQLSDAGFILRYKVDVNDKANVNIYDRVLAARVSAPEQPITELALIQVVNFSKHQKIDISNEKDSDLPEPKPIDTDTPIKSRTIDYNKPNESNTKDEERKGKERNDLNVLFDVFWDEYDKRVNKFKTEKKWNSLRDEERTAIMAYLPGYKKSKPDKQFRKDPLTFLNNRAWEDEVILNGHAGKQTGHSPGHSLQIEEFQATRRTTKDPTLNNW